MTAEDHSAKKRTPKTDLLSTVLVILEESFAGNPLVQMVWQGLEHLDITRHYAGGVGLRKGPQRESRQARSESRNSKRTAVGGRSGQEDTRVVRVPERHGSSGSSTAGSG